MYWTISESSGWEDSSDSAGVSESSGVSIPVDSSWLTSEELSSSVEGSSCSGSSYWGFVIGWLDSSSAEVFSSNMGDEVEVSPWVAPEEVTSSAWAERAFPWKSNAQQSARERIRLAIGLILWRCFICGSPFLDEKIGCQNPRPFLYIYYTARYTGRKEKYG